MHSARWHTVAATLTVIVAAGLAYAGGLGAPFIMDDFPSIPKNTSIRSLWPINSVLWYPAERGRTVDGRPLLNLSFAINRAIIGETPAAFRGVNVAIHVANAILLGLLSRLILTAPAALPRPEAVCDGIAFATSLLWALHPLCTGAVTYVVQRAESLAALMMLAAVTVCVKGLEQRQKRSNADFLSAASEFGGPHAAVWLGAVTSLSALAGAAKETAVVMPLVTVLIDRAVIAGSWRGCLRHWPWHVAAAASWPIVLIMLSVLGGRGTSAGFVSLMSSWHYLLTQSWAIWVYLLRIVWPATLVFDYGNSVSVGLAESWPWLVATSVLFIGICLGFGRWPAKFLGPLLFFVLLAPTSSVIPVKTQTVAEHRAYLPLAAIVAAAATFVGDELRRLQAPRWLAVLMIVAAASLLGGRTVARNLEFHSPEGLWRQSLAIMPNNSRAMNNLSVLLIAKPSKAGLPEAESLLARIAAREPERQDMLLNRATLRKKQGRFDDAIADLSHYIRLDSTHAGAYADRGYLHWKSGRLPEAIADFKRALVIDPETTSAWTNLGNALTDSGRPAEGERCFEQARAVDPTNAVTWWHCGIARAARGETASALDAFETAVRLDPEDADARFNRGTLLAMMRRPSEARADFDAVIRLDPSRGDAWLKRALLAVEQGDLARARADLAHYASLGGRVPSDLEHAVGLGK